MKRNVLMTLAILIVSSFSFSQAGNLVVADYFGNNHYNKVQATPSFSWTSIAEPCTSGNAPHGMTCDTIDQILYEIVHLSESVNNVHFFRNDFVNNEDVTSYPGLSMYAISYSYSTNKLYTVGMATNSAGATQTLYEVDKMSGALTAIGDLGITGYANEFYPFALSSSYGTVIGLTWDPIDDVLLATTADSKLYQINPTSGAETLIGNTSAAYHGLCWDHEFDRLMAKTSGGSVREINKATGATITTFGSADGQLGMCYAPWAGGSGSALNCGTVTPSTCSNSVNTFSVTACASYTVPSGDEVYSTPGTFTVMDTIPNQEGCDSIMTINLTINAETTNSIVVSSCGPYTVPSGDEVYSTPGTITVMDTIPNSFGCDSIITIDLTINDLDVTTTSNLNTITANLTSAAYQWIDCNTLQIIPGETNQSYTPTQNGEYAVIVNDGTCEDTSACVQITGLSFTENLKDLFSVYPNPSGHNFTITLDEPTSVEEISIFNTTGQMIWTAQQIEKDIQVELEMIPSGLYLIHIVTKQQSLVHQHIIK